MSLRAVLALPVVAAPVCAGGARAGVPSPLRSIIDSCIVACPLGDVNFSVEVHQYNGQPYVNGDVVLDFSPCPSFHILVPDLPTQYQFFPYPSVVLKYTDSSGRAEFPLFAGGVCASMAKVYCSGQLLKLRPAASFDQNGDLGVTDADLALIAGKIGTTDPTADFNCDGSVTQADYDIAAAHLGHIHPTSPLVGV